MVDINELDLNLLKVFDAVMRTRNVTSAGQLVGLTQSSTSNAMRRLRAVFKDELFIRSASEMVPTSAALEIAAPVAEALQRLRLAFGHDKRFDPASSEREFTLLMTDVGDIMFLPMLVARLRAAAPGVKLSVLQLDRRLYAEALESGQAELAVGAMPRELQDLPQQRLRLEPLVCIGRRSARFDPDACTLARYLDAPHIAIVSPAIGEQQIVRALGPLAARRKVALRLQHYLPVPAIVGHSDLLATIPLAVATALATQGGLARFAPPFEIEPMTIRQYWHRRSSDDPGHRWLRQEIYGLFSQ